MAQFGNQHVLTLYVYGHRATPFFHMWMGYSADITTFWKIVVKVAQITPRSWHAVKLVKINTVLIRVQPGNLYSRTERPAVASTVVYCCGTCMRLNQNQTWLCDHLYVRDFQNPIDVRGCKVTSWTTRRVVLESHRPLCVSTIAIRVESASVNRRFRLRICRP